MKEGNSSRNQRLRSELFGSYKAEWLKERIFDLFAEPLYFPELAAASPTVLLGGRGTGKTTVLRCMSYEGRFALANHDPQSIDTWTYYGMYYRVNTNRVTAFDGPELTKERWSKNFGHYMNLVLCHLAVSFLQWHQIHSAKHSSLPTHVFRSVASTLAIGEATTLPELAKNIGGAKRAFEAYINNVAEAPPIRLSLQGAPIDELFAHLHGIDQFKEKHFFFLIDEYENFTDEQQRVANTLIKHSGELYSFKIGVRELGWRVKTTLNNNEQLISPSDYTRIDISEKLDQKAFESFALQVSNERVRRLAVDQQASPDVRQLLPGLSEDEEARRLNRENGPLEHATVRLSAIVPSDQQHRFDSLTAIQRYLMVLWSDATEESLNDIWESYVTNPTRWLDRFNNYSHGVLYSIRRGKRGIRKYFCGARTFTQMAASNIRYFLELLDQSLALHVKDDLALDQPISPETQTLAAQSVGRMNLAELEGLSVHGGTLTKLVLGLGRICQVMAANPVGHAPEVNQFYLSHKRENIQDEEVAKVVEILKAAVMHLALVRSPGNKLLDVTDTKEYDYMLHPIFSAFFIFSYRQKRKFAIAPNQFLALISDHKKAIREILSTHNHDSTESPSESAAISEAEPLPDQLCLFGPYYNVSAD